MILLRMLFTLGALIVAISGGMYVLTNDRRYLQFCWQVFRFVAFALLIIGALYFLERYVLVGWGVLI